MRRWLGSSNMVVHVWKWCRRKLVPREVHKIFRPVNAAELIQYNEGVNEQGALTSWRFLPSLCNFSN
jgi:hypothetical protein